MLARCGFIRLYMHAFVGRSHAEHRQAEFCSMLVQRRCMAAVCFAAGNSPLQVCQAECPEFAVPVLAELPGNRSLVMVCSSTTSWTRPAMIQQTVREAVNGTHRGPRPREAELCAFPGTHSLHGAQNMPVACSGAPIRTASTAPRHWHHRDFPASLADGIFVQQSCRA